MPEFSGREQGVELGVDQALGREIVGKQGTRLLSLPGVITGRDANRLAVTK